MTSLYRSSAIALSEDTASLVDAVDEPVDLLAHRVEVEARAVRGRDAEPRHQRLAAVMPGPNRDTFGVEHLRHVVRVNALDVERDDSRAAVGGRPVGREAGNLGEPVERVRRELRLVLLD